MEAGNDVGREGKHPTQSKYKIDDHDEIVKPSRSIAQIITQIWISPTFLEQSPIKVYVPVEAEAGRDDGEANPGPKYVFVCWGIEEGKK